MINDQEYITTKLKKTLEKMIILSAPRLNNLIAMVIGIICSQSVVLSKISQELKDNYSLGTEESKIKKLQRWNWKEVDRLSHGTVRGRWQRLPMLMMQIL